MESNMLGKAQGSVGNDATQHERSPHPSPSGIPYIKSCVQLRLVIQSITLLPVNKY